MQKLKSQVQQIIIIKYIKYKYSIKNLSLGMLDINLQ
jgi:hypothetical protein